MSRGQPLFPPKPTRAWAGDDFHRTLITDPNWVCEPKYDGDRCLVQFTMDGPELWSRHGRPSKYKHCDDLIAELREWDLPQGCILDCELIAEPKPRQDLYVFDVPSAGQHLAYRREVLESLFEDVTFSRIHLTPHMNKATAYEEALKSDLEGIVFKRLDSPYEWKRGSNDPPVAYWFKMKPSFDFS